MGATRVPVARRQASTSMRGCPLFVFLRSLKAAAAQRQATGLPVQPTLGTGELLEVSASACRDFQPRGSLSDSWALLFCQPVPGDDGRRSAAGPLHSAARFGEPSAAPRHKGQRRQAPHARHEEPRIPATLPWGRYQLPARTDQVGSAVRTAALLPAFAQKPQT